MSRSSLLGIRTMVSPASVLPQASLFAMVCLVAGCVADNAVPTIDEAPADSISEALWLDNTATLWPWGAINVCFQGFTTAERSAIRTIVENGWDRAAHLNFKGWLTCPVVDAATSDLIVVSLGAVGIAGGHSVCANATPQSCAGLTGKARSGDFNRITFANATPAAKTVLHEFGHALGFLHETDHPTGCIQRTSGGTSLENEGDPGSVMAAFTNCNEATALSTWDILGARRVYGLKAPGMIAGRNNLCANIFGGSTGEGANIVGWPCEGFSWNQQWRRDNNSLLLKAQLGSTTRCLNVKGGVVGTGFTPLVSWSCNEAFTNEQMRLRGMDWRAMGNRCMQAASASQSSEIFLHSCTNGPLQKWDFFEKDRRIRLSGTNLCVNVPNANTADGTKLILWPCSTGTPFSNEVFTFANGRIMFGTKAFNIAGGTQADGNRLVLWPPASGAPHHNEQFTVSGQIRVLGQCLDMSDSAAPDGGQLGVRACSSSATQVWEYWW